MKRQSILLLALVLLSSPVQPCQADLYFFDDFDDGNTDGWWLGFIARFGEPFFQNSNLPYGSTALDHGLAKD